MKLHFSFIILAVTTLPAYAAAASERFPADAGALNVRDFGAKGDGITDDTAAINAALTASGTDTGEKFWQDRIVYLPQGTYLVSAPIMKRYANGKYGSGSILIGQDRKKTVIKLKDNTDGYGDPAHPKPVIFTTAKLLDGTPNSGGKDYLGKGEGNDAFMNFIENMTIETGKGNSGAIGIDYLANNMGAVRNVTVHGNGTTGIAMTRKWPGPALLENVAVEGFSTGIDIGNTEYGVTLENITISNAHTGLRNDHNAVSIHNIDIEGTAQPIINNSSDGLMVIYDAKLMRSSLKTTGEAIENHGYMNLYALHTAGYATTLGQPKMDITGVFEGNTQLKTAATWSLPVADAPMIPEEAPEKWVSVTKYGAEPDSGKDATEAIRKAFNSGAATIYFPHGTYLISENIAIPASVRRIEGMTSTIHSVENRSDSFRRDQGMFRATNNKRSLLIERIAFDNSYLGDQAGVEAAGTQPLILRDVVGAGVITLLRPENGGKAFLENTCCGTMSIAGKQGVWARQFNSEGGGIRIENKGAPLWILGVKTEQDCTVLDNKDGAQSEILGGLLYITGNHADPKIPAFRNTHSRLLMSYAEESFNRDATYAIHLEDTQHGQVKTTPATSLPERNLARVVPQLEGK
ncbi:MAG TPA: glycosyl hydrolase family 28-related protein [Rickettsiales bacterium]|nr:glycosyl hydrolase family 28-related protein [Rickettsiales bacterium]